MCRHNVTAGDSPTRSQMSAHSQTSPCSKMPTRLQTSTHSQMHTDGENVAQYLSVESAVQCADLARRFAATMPPPPLLVHLKGNLGAGKTFWAREVIAALGGGQATSPTFAWALSYPAERVLVHHMDLFRLPNGAPPPEELLELLDESALCLIEWAERAQLPPPDVRIEFSFIQEVAQEVVLDVQKLAQNQEEDAGGEKRDIILYADSDKGKTWLRDFCR